MQGRLHFVYEIRMNTAVTIHETYQNIPVASAPQVLTCIYTLLSAWEHDDLAAPFWRLYWNDRPGAYLILPHEKVPIEPGKIVLIPPHTCFGTSLKRKVGHLYVHFTLGLDRAVTPGIVFQHAPPPTERTWIRRLVEAAESPVATRTLEASFLVQALVNASLATVPVEYWNGRLTDARITQALQSLSQKGPAVDNAALAHVAGMNPNAFIRKFVQATGHSPHQYRLRLRIEQAAAILREGRRSIDEIATETGFCDRFHFSRVFKQVMGASPARYRRAARVPLV